jgi:polyhydroxyalkanoate synthase subunit PhaC
MSTPTWSPASPTTSAPWQACYRSTRLLGGRARFVLSSGGHIASMVNRSGIGKASFRTAARTPPDPTAWLDQSTTEPGSWWPDYLGWPEQRTYVLDH